MQKIKKLLASFLVVLLILMSAPLSGFVGLDLNLPDFSFKAEAEVFFDSNDGSWGFEIENGKAILLCVGFLGTTEDDVSGAVTVPSSAPVWAEETYDIIGWVDTVGIGDYAFSSTDSFISGTSGVTSITLPDTIKTIGEGAFSGLTNLKSINLGNGVESIGMGAFFGCTSLKDIIIPNSVTSMGEFVFAGCTGLKTITLGNGIKSIGEYEFAELTNLESVTLGNGLETIGDGAFLSCGIKNITIPASVTSIGMAAFVGCENLSYITVASENQNYSSANGVLFDKDKTILIQYPVGNTRTHYEIPKGVTTIAMGAFALISNLKSVAIPKTVTSIEDGAFMDCTGLTDVYYEGSEEDWKKIAIGEGNEPLTNATIHYGTCLHDFGDWIVRRWVTCEFSGENYRICSKCGFEETQTISAFGHNFSETYTVDKAATCTEEGSESRHCSGCEKTADSRPIPAKGHSYKAVVTEPTCTAEGYTTYTCSCGDTYTADETEATGHTYGDDNICDNCDERKECSCNCHKTGIAKLFFNIINFFQKLFGQNKVCVCGAKH